MIHVYTGDGKGKTTAAVGLAVRAAGSGRKVVFAQFIKSMPSGELVPLEKLGVTVIRSRTRFGFTFQMDAATKELCGNEQRRILDDAASAVREQGIALLVLDEVLDALGAAMLDEDILRDLIRTLSQDCELVLTGRPVPDWLAEAADYHSHVKKIKHPFDRGVKARDGIER
ncbi:MAG: cob(I)yrinic acid a,c-diamide adenosyltransferase [Spirochaetaceae bacterium]|jgi:cob(I)alamin adenosyltransferase|nr:cob(I)yrinic acid a,c-diamide adenosyltransferase [Spirochaetaceae bacterium]